MLATLVIGLREGLEATLIVGIIAAFLKRNNVSMKPMWIGVTIAVLMSIGVGVALQVVAQALPQAQQEAMEAIIGTVAVVFVTAMIAWMRGHAKDLKGELEREARVALGAGTGLALGVMAFLAVLKEGFETSVFLLATFQASSSVGLAALGAVVGVAAAVVIGLGIYTGGVRMNLAKFFTGTGIFLVFVAAGLALTVVRRAHEAGWLTIGQQKTVDLTWLVPNGSIRSALITGVLGIPADPRVIEVVAWFAYLVPVLLLAVWPRAWRPTPARVPLVRSVLAAVMAVAAVALFIGLPGGAVQVPETATVTGGGAGSVTLAPGGGSTALRVRSGQDTTTTTFRTADGRAVTHAGADAERFRTTEAASTAGRPTTVTLDELVAYFGRLPVGISPGQNPGPFTAHWTARATTTLWTADGGVLDARRSTFTVLTLSGGGLPGSRTLSSTADAWHVPTATVQRTGAALVAASTSASEMLLWRAFLPIALGLGALTQAVLALRDRRRSRDAHRASQADPAITTAPTPGTQSPGDSTRKTAYAVR